MNVWQRHRKKIVAIAAVIVAIPLLVIAGSWVYVEFIKEDPPAALDESDLSDRLAATTTVASGGANDGAAPGSTGAPTADGGATTVATAPADGGGGAAAGSVDGTWNVTTESELRYRVGENINGFDTEGVGSTNQITGALTIAGTTVSAADFTVDMTTFSSDESRRDGQFNGRIMAVGEFPTSRFVLTSPIELGSIPADGQTITATASGDLTLRGTTRPVTFELTAQLQGGRIGVLGNIPVVFADFGIPNPSFATITTEDHGLLEFVLVFERA